MKSGYPTPDFDIARDAISPLWPYSTLFAVGGRHLEEGHEQQRAQDRVDGVFQAGARGRGEPPQQAARSHRREVDRDLMTSVE